MPVAVLPACWTVVRKRMSALPWSAGEELLEHQPQDRRVDVVVLSPEGSPPRVGDQRRKGIGGGTHEPEAGAAVDDDGRHRDGLRALRRDAVVARVDGEVGGQL